MFNFPGIIRFSHVFPNFFIFSHFLHFLHIFFTLFALFHFFQIFLRFQTFFNSSLYTLKFLYVRRHLPQILRSVDFFLFPLVS